MKPNQNVKLAALLLAVVASCTKLQELPEASTPDAMVDDTSEPGPVGGSGGEAGRGQADASMGGAGGENRPDANSPPQCVGMECPVAGMSVCFKDAVCCPGTKCREASCMAGTQTPAQTCNDQGQCPASTGSACPSNFGCDGATCHKTCSDSNQCVNQSICSNGNCIRPGCGNGIMESGETCDNGPANGDGAACGTDCKTCNDRGRKQCGAVCLPAGQCCIDADCANDSTTAPRCNSATKTCWKRATIR